MKEYENYYCRPMPPCHHPSPCSPPPCHHKPECECWCEYQCEHECNHHHHECNNDEINLYTREDCHNHGPSHHHCECSFADSISPFINQKVMITVGCRRMKVVILDVSCATVKCLLLGQGKLIYLNVDRIDNVKPLCY